MQVSKRETEVHLRKEKLMERETRREEEIRLEGRLDEQGGRNRCEGKGFMVGWCGERYAGVKCSPYSILVHS